MLLLGLYDSPALYSSPIEIKAHYAVKCNGLHFAIKIIQDDLVACCTLKRISGSNLRKMDPGLTRESGK